MPPSQPCPPIQPFSISLSRKSIKRKTYVLNTVACIKCNLCSRCSRDQLTTMLENGDSQRARFSFPAFRFIEQQNQTISTYYLHCITRLCERATCTQFKVLLLFKLWDKVMFIVDTEIVKLKEMSYAVWLNIRVIFQWTAMQEETRHTNHNNKRWSFRYHPHHIRTY